MKVRPLIVLLLIAAVFMSIGCADRSARNAPPAADTQTPPTAATVQAAVTGQPAAGPTSYDLNSSQAPTATADPMSGLTPDDVPSGDGDASDLADLPEDGLPTPPAWP